MVLVFQFQTFSERVAAVDIDVFHRIRGAFSQSPDEVDTFFHETLEKWNVLNCTESFEKFRKELGTDVQSLALLLVHKERIVEVLIKYLEAKNVCSLQPILE